MTVSAFILEQKLIAAQKDIETLRMLVDYTLAIIAAAGGTVSFSNEHLEQWRDHPWRHEFDGREHVFSVEDKP